jgi:hypothetical protein
MTGRDDGLVLLVEHRFSIASACSTLIRHPSVAERRPFPCHAGPSPISSTVYHVGATGLLSLVRPDDCDGMRCGIGLRMAVLEAVRSGQGGDH